MTTPREWEPYGTLSDDSQKVCLGCAAEAYIGNEDNWIALRDEDIAFVTFELVRQACHVLAVNMPVPREIEIFDSVTLARLSGGLVLGLTEADPTPDAAVVALREILTQAKDNGHNRALLVLDGIYQFAVSIGVYVPIPADSEQKDNDGSRETVQ